MTKLISFTYGPEIKVSQKATLPPRQKELAIHFTTTAFEACAFQ